jgi:hypothetical protein
MLTLDRFSEIPRPYLLGCSGPPPAIPKGTLETSKLFQGTGFSSKPVLAARLLRN